jgi:phosphoglycolate phosphatase
VVGYIGNGVQRLVEGALQGSDADVDEALRINKEYYYSHLTVHTTLYEGVKQGVRRLTAAGHKLAVLTNKPGDPSRLILEYFGIGDSFAAIIGGGDVENLKPEPDGVHRCMEIAEADAANTWMIGDHYTDLAAADKAGIKCAFVQYGFGEERGCKPDVYFASFSELVGYFC